MRAQITTIHLHSRLLNDRELIEFWPKLYESRADEETRNSGQNRDFSQAGGGVKSTMDGLSAGDINFSTSNELKLLQSLLSTPDLTIDGVNVFSFHSTQLQGVDPRSFDIESAEVPNL
ncbi:hypothetical protein F511_21988 [Dorcoceras hygrometricum]|uniref:Uncharacterized protein n=1 Tax=Dorcoceras hygrometricum TaxID=472368 RepID=A0A2Z7C952_9LAMI|nr:hypothetical protein F511_21988 [Dorcoceras hygrometricum]